eukprot:24532-Pelagococcus_subviridis.AAC.1
MHARPVPDVYPHEIVPGQEPGREILPAPERLAQRPPERSRRRRLHPIFRPLGGVHRRQLELKGVVVGD